MIQVMDRLIEKLAEVLESLADKILPVAMPVPARASR